MKVRHLRIWMWAVVAAMLFVTLRASLHTPLWELPASVLGHPWFTATLADAYFAFLAFWLWLAWREPHWTARLLGLAAILLLGNFAMAGYVLWQLRNQSGDAPIDFLFARRHG